MQQHLRFVEELAPGPGTFAVWQQFANSFVYDLAQQVSLWRRDILETDIPASRMKRQECYFRAAFSKMPVQGSGELLGFRRGNPENTAVRQQELIALDMEMDRIGAKPVAMIRFANFPPIGLKRDGRNRPVLLFCNSKGVAKPGFDFPDSSLLDGTF